MKVRQVVWEGVGGLKTYNHTVTQPKLDGSQYHLHIKNCKAIALTSRRVSVKTGELSEKLHHFPMLKKQKFPQFKKETILVCEVSADHLYESFKSGEIKNKKGVAFNWDKRSNYVASVMNSNESNNHQLVLVAFDILYWNGLHVEHSSYKAKLMLLERYFLGYEVGRPHKSGNVYGMQTYDTHNKQEIDKVFKWITKGKKLEGVVVKDLNSNASQKIKRECDADCIIIGFTEGTGKYKQNNWIGSIVVGVFAEQPKNISGNKLGKSVVELELEKGNIIEVGKISGFDEVFRKQISQYKNRFLGRVVQCKYMQWTGNKMRHPRIGEQAIRTDKLIKRCTLSQFEES